jgi:hypothetical protein
MKEKTSFQNYIPNIGWGNCISRVDEEGSLHLYFVTDSKPFAKYLPNLEGVSPTGMYNKFLIEVVVDKTNKTSFRNIFNTKTDFKSYYLSVASVQLVNDALVVYLQVMGQSKYGRIGFIQVSEKMR